jgi:hypothetical protein
LSLAVTQILLRRVSQFGRVGSVQNHLYSY